MKDFKYPTHYLLRTADLLSDFDPFVGYFLKSFHINNLLPSSKHYHKLSTI